MGCGQSISVAKVQTPVWAGPPQPASTELPPPAPGQLPQGALTEDEAPGPSLETEDRQLDSSQVIPAIAQPSPLPGAKEESDTHEHLGHDSSEAPAPGEVVVSEPVRDDPMPPTPEVKEEIKDISAGTMDAQQGEAATGGQRQVEKIVRNDAAGGIAGAATFLDMGCMFKTLIRMSMATMFATEIESPAALPSSVEAAVSSMAWELDEETGLLRSRVLASILMGYEPLPEEVNSNTNEADHKGMTPGQIDEAPMASDQEACEDGEAHGGSYTADDGAEVELGGPALFVRAHPAPLPDPLLFGSGADDQVAIGWLQPYGHHRKPGISATDSANVSLYRKWGQALAGNGPDVPRLGLVLFPTLRNAYGGSLAAAAGFLQEVRPVLWGLAACNMIVDEALGRLLAEAIAGSPGLRFLALSFYLGATEEGLGLVCPAVGRSGSLRVVAIPGRFIGPQGAEALATSLAENSSVLYLLMGPMAPIVNAKESVESGDEILGEPLGLPTDKGCMSLARMMIHNSTIRVMDLSGCGAGDETCRVLAEALKTNRTLAELFLCDNAIGNEGASSMTAAMVHNDTLILLDLHNNPQTVVPFEIVERGENHQDSFLEKSEEDGMEKWFSPMGGEEDALAKAINYEADFDIADFDARTAARGNIDRRGMAVVEFMREVGDEGGETMTRLKWFLVGRGEAGKTSLFRTLQDPAKAQLVEKLDRTILMDVEEWKPAEREGLHVSVWDCGGQDEYWRVGNQTFLTSRRTLYIVVVDLSYSKPVVIDGSGLAADGKWGKKQEMFCLKKYVNTLLTHVPSCVLVLVGTKKDKIPDPPDEDGDANARLVSAIQTVKEAISEQNAKLQTLEGQYKSKLIRCRTAELKLSDHEDKTKLKGTIKWLEEQLSFVRKRRNEPPVIAAEPIAVSCGDAQAMEGLRDMLLDLSLDQTIFRDMASVVPKSWTKLHALVDAQQLAFPLMHWQQFQDVMFDRCGCNSLPRFKRAVSFLHSIGVLLHYDQVENLKDIVVVQPTWLLDAFRQVIRHDFRHIERLGGRMSRFARQLRQEGELSLMLSWGDRVEPAVSTDLLVTLMRQFDLAFPRSASSYFVPSMCPSVPQSELLRANWPPTIGPSEALLGLSVEMIPAPRGAFERLMARLSDVFQVLEGAWRCSDAAMSSGAGVLIRPRDLSFGSHVLLLVRMDDTGRCVVLARQAKALDISVSCASVLCVVEMLAQLLRDAFAGVVSTITGLLCPHCLRTTEEIGHAVPLGSFIGNTARVGSFAVDVVKQFLKGAAHESEGLLQCPSCGKPAGSMTRELHGLRMAGRSATLQALREIRAKAKEQIQAQSVSRKNLARAASLIGRSVPLSGSLTAISRRTSIGRALSRKASRAMAVQAVQGVPSSSLMQSGPTFAEKLGKVPVASAGSMGAGEGSKASGPVAVVPKSLDAPRLIESGSLRGGLDDEGSVDMVRELDKMRLAMLKGHHEAALAVQREMGGDWDPLPEVSIKVPAGINGEEKEIMYGTFLHPIKPGHAARPDQVLQDLLGPVSGLLSRGWSPPPLIGSSFYIDFCVRDQQIREIGAPPMLVISWRKLRELGHIPRSSEGHAVSIAQALAEVAERHASAPPPRMLQYEDNPFGGASVPAEYFPCLDSELGTVPRINLVMVSHRWCRPSRDPALAHPDDEAGTKAGMLVEYGLREHSSEAARETYFWIDYCSVDQDNPWPGIQALPLYISNCAGGMVVVANDEYESRAWCRLEQVLYTSFSSKPVFTAVPTPEGVTGTERWLSDYKKKLLNPREGNLTSEADREVVGMLTDLAAQHYGKSWVYPHREMCKVLKGVNLTANIEFGLTEVALEDHSDYSANDMTGAGPMDAITE